MRISLEPINTLVDSCIYVFLLIVSLERTESTRERNSCIFKGILSYFSINRTEFSWTFLESYFWITDASFNHWKM